MKNLYIMGTAGSGKTAMAVGLALILQERGFKVAYFKPVGNPPDTAGRHDEDGVLMKSVLDMEHDIDTIVPFTAGPSYLSGQRNCATLDRILSAHRAVAQGMDVVIIGGAGFPHIMGCLGLDAISLARELKAASLFMIRIENDYSLDQAFFINSYLKAMGLPVLGNVFNNVSRPLLAKTEGIYKSIMAERGHHTLGIIPRRPEIASPTVAEYHDVLGGDILTGEDRLENIVEDIVIGAMTIESALGYLRRAPNKALITGGDRSDIALAALETSTSALILTGGLYPDVKLIARAEEKGVPVILVHLDTFTTIEKMSEVTRKIKPTDRTGIKISRENVERYCDTNNIINYLEKM